MDELIYLLAGTEGFEPTNDGIKTRCLTTWRRPIVKILLKYLLKLFLTTINIIIN